MITLTFLVLLLCSAWLAQAAWRHARGAIRTMAVSRPHATLGDHVPAAQSLA